MAEAARGRGRCSVVVIITEEEKDEQAKQEGGTEDGKEPQCEEDLEQAVCRQD